MEKTKAEQVSNSKQLFAVQGTYTQEVYSEVVWKRGGIRLNGWPAIGNKRELAKLYPGESIETDYILFGTGEKREYEVFEVDESLRTSFLALAGSKTPKKSMEEWVKRWGFLGVCETRGTLSLKGFETFSAFWKAVEEFSILWERYKQATQRDVEKMREWIRFEPHVQDEVFRIAGFHEDYQTRTIIKGRNDSYCPLWNETVEEIGNNPIYYQLSAIIYLTEEIEKRIGAVRLSHSGLGMHAYSVDEDAFSVKTRLECSTLLQALYLQFYSLVAERNKRVCPVCNRVFIPKHSRQKYCNLDPMNPNKCKWTYEKRVQRARKQIIERSASNK